MRKHILIIVPGNRDFGFSEGTHGFGGSGAFWTGFLVVAGIKMNGFCDLTLVRSGTRLFFHHFPPFLDDTFQFQSYTNFTN